MTKTQLKIKIDECDKALPAWRRQVIDIAKAMGFSEQDAKDIGLAVFEACANAIHHGSQGGDEYVSLCIHPLADRLEATVEDSGHGLSCPIPDEMPPPSSVRGRGIPLMRTIMDNVQFESDGGCRVTLTKYLKHKTPTSK